MNFWAAFFRTLQWRPKQAFAGLYWHVTGRKVRARNRLRLGVAQAPFAYDFWISSVERQADITAGAAGRIGTWSFRPKFSILIHCSSDNSQQELLRTLGSLDAQIYDGWDVVLTCDPGLGNGLAKGLGDRIRVIEPETPHRSQALATAIAQASGDYVVPLAPGNALPETALFHLAEALQADPRAEILFGDHDEIDPHGHRRRPWFKPLWNEEMFLAQDYISEVCAIEIALARRVVADGGDLGGAPVFALLLRASSRVQGGIVHVPRIVCHVQAGSPPADQDARVAEVSRHVAASGATASRGPFGSVQVSWPLPTERPLVSIIIPTRDKVELLRACVGSVLAATTYAEFEIIVVDNGSAHRATLDYLSAIANHPAISILTYDRPYNYSAINNFAAAHARGTFLCLLNNDTEVIVEGWLTEMMRYAVRPGIGAVGAKLLYDDGSIQHAGVIVGLGEAAGHAHRFAPSDELGYFAQPHVAHFASAVTGACLVIDKQKFEAVGGLDEQNLAIAFNDVDLCLKLERAGWRNVYVPHAVLVHHESKSRGRDTSPEHIDRYMRELALLQSRWGTKTYRDPLHNPNLDRYSESFIIRL